MDRQRLRAGPGGADPGGWRAGRSLRPQARLYRRGDDLHASLRGLRALGVRRDADRLPRGPGRRRCCHVIAHAGADLRGLSAGDPERAYRTVGCRERPGRGRRQRHRRPAARGLPVVVDLLGERSDRSSDDRDLPRRCQGISSAWGQPARCAWSCPERRRLVSYHVRLGRLGRCDVALAGRRRVRRSRHRSARVFRHARAQGGVPHGAACAATNRELRPGVRRVPAGLPGVRRVHLLRHAVLPEHRAMVGAADRPVLAIFLHPVLRRRSAPGPARDGAARRSSGRLRLPDRRRRYRRHEPAEYDDAVCVAGHLLCAGRGGLRADGSGELSRRYGGSPGRLVWDRVRSLQRCPPGWHRDGSGHPRVGRHRRDPG